MFGLGKRAAENRDEGKRLFELAMKAATAFNSNEALELYGQSIKASDNPAPYINRANLLGKRIRHFEALQDLLRAQQLDRSQGKQFGAVIAREVARTMPLADLCTNGMQPKLVADLKVKGNDYVVGRLITEAFKIPIIRWEYRMAADPMLEFHLFNELDNIIKFDDMAAYPEAEELVRLYPAEFIELKLGDCPDVHAYAGHEAILHRFLCCYPLDQMRRLRRSMIYEIHEQLLIRDFGAMHMSLDSECNGIIKEAEAFISRGKHQDAKVPPAIGGFDATDLLAEEGKFDRVIDQIAQQLTKVIAREDHVYRYLMEEADLLSKGTDFDKSILKATGITSLEYEGESSKFEKYRDARPGADYLNDKIIPDFEALIGNADKVRGLLLAKIYGGHEKAMCRLRLKYAQRYRDVCTAESDAQAWADVVASIEGRLIVLGSSPGPATDTAQQEKGAGRPVSTAQDTGVTVGGLLIAKKPESQEELLDLVHRVAPEIAKRVPMEQDFYWFLIEQYDRLRGKSDYFDELLDHVGLHPIEYEGMRSEESYVGHPNPGVAFFRDEVTQPLSALYDKDGVGYVTTALFTGFCEIYASGVAALRRKYAEHYHNNCVSQGNFNSAERWVAVLDSL